MVFPRVFFSFPLVFDRFSYDLSVSLDFFLGFSMMFDCFLYGLLCFFYGFPGVQCVFLML